MTGAMRMDVQDEWVGKTIGAVVSIVVGSVIGWMGRRPLEKAGMLEAVNARIQTYMTHLEGEITRSTAQHAKCEERLDASDAARELLSLEVALMRGQVAQEKQTAASILAAAKD